MPPIRVLIAEDHPADQCLLTTAVQGRRSGVSVALARRKSEFAEAIRSQTFDCAVIDFHLLDCDAEELLGLLRQVQPECPAIVVSSSDEQDIVVRSFRSGTVDFVHKDQTVADGVLWDQICACIRKRRQEERRERRLERRVRRLAALAEKDPLTGLANRRAVDRLLRDERRRTLDRRSSVAVIMLDLDHFKGVNDRFGHGFGDQVLQSIGRLIRENVSDDDVAARWGGEEFVVIRSGAPLASAWAWAERFRRSIGELDLSVNGQVVPISASMGLLAMPSQDFSAQAIDGADEALYLAKRRGRNCVCTHEMVMFEKLVDPTGGGGLESRLETLLHRARAILGPTQREHLSDHSRSVSAYARRVGRRMGLPDDRLNMLFRAGLCHDLGKFLVPDDVLAKTGPLSPDERLLLSRHASDGAEMVRHLGGEEDVAACVAYHHHRFDEFGHAESPREPVPLGARILNVADAVVTMATDRPYQAARSKPMIRRELICGRGRQFDPDVVDAAKAEEIHLDAACPSGHVPAISPT